MENIKMFFIYCLFLYILTINFNKFLMSLISIELLMTITSCMMLLMMMKMSQDYFVIYFLIIMVTESVLGLSLLIMMSRIFNNDSTSMMNIQW